MATFTNMSKDDQKKSGNEKGKSRANYDKAGDDKHGKLYTFKVIANAGDPGMTEDEHYDILSRFVICEKESGNRVPTNHQAHSLFYLVKRPDHLWITSEATDSSESNYVSARRKDYMGNVNVGKASNPSIKTIPNINRPYAVGEIITAKKLPQILNPATSSFFSSMFSNDAFKNVYPNGPQQITNPQEAAKYTMEHWTHYGPPSNTQIAEGKVFNSEGQEVASNRGAGGYQNAKQLKPLYPADKVYQAALGAQTEAEKVMAVNAGINYSDKKYYQQDVTSAYFIILHYYLVHYALGICNPDSMTTIEALKNHRQKYQGFGVNTTPGFCTPAGPQTQQECVSVAGSFWTPPVVQKNPDLINQKGGFIGRNVLLTNVAYEDINTDDKQRVTTDECMPLIIASPNQFPTPKYRQAGAIVYQPTYAKVASQQ